jgi:hypothetical protein
LSFTDHGQIQKQRTTPAAGGFQPYLEQSSLAIEQSSLAIEQSSLAIEQSSLAIEQSSLAIEHCKFPWQARTSQGEVITKSREQK